MNSNGLFIALFLSCSAAAAQLPAMSVSDDATSRAARATYAKEVLREVDTLWNMLPTPRPSDRTWVESEQRAVEQIADSSIATSRRIQLYESPEFQHVKLHGHLVEVRNALQCAANITLRSEREFFCWAVASYLMSDRSLFVDAVNILHRSRRLPSDTVERAKLGGLEGFAIRFDIYARNIQDQLMLPYLRQQVR